jgi:hypothetical protein
MVKVLLGAIAGGALLPHGIQNLAVHPTNTQAQVL